MHWNRFVWTACALVLTPIPAPALELSSLPAEVTLAPGATVLVAVRVSASGEDPVDGLRLDHFAPEDIALELAATAPNEALPAGASATWVYRLRRAEGGTRLGPVLWRLTGIERRQGGRVPVAATTVTKVAASEEKEAVATLELRSGFETFRDLRGAAIFLVVENETGSDLMVEAIRPYAPSFMEVEAVDQDLPLTVPPRSTRSLQYSLSATAVQAGTHTLLWEADLAWNEGGRRQRATLLASKDVPVGMLGESELLNVLKVPSLLLLPGILVLLTWHWLRKSVHPRATEAKPIKLDAVEFLFGAATLSLAAAFVYPLATGFVFGDPRDFVVLAGFRDIVNLWWGAIFAGFVGWAVWYGGGSVVRRGRSWLEKWRMPGERSSARSVLKKLRNELSLQRRKVQFEAPDGVTRQGLVLFERKGRTWLAPTMVVRVAAAAEQRVVDAVAKGPRALWDVLRETGATVHWAPGVGMIEKPCLLEPEVVRQPVDEYRHNLVEPEWQRGGEAAGGPAKTGSAEG